MTVGAIKRLMFALEQAYMPSSRGWIYKLMQQDKLKIKTFEGRYYLTDNEIERIVSSLKSKGSYDYRKDNK